jgi:hypothetical protein
MEHLTNRFFAWNGSNSMVLAPIILLRKTQRKTGTISPPHDPLAFADPSFVTGECMPVFTRSEVSVLTKWHRGEDVPYVSLNGYFLYQNGVFDVFHELKKNFGRRLPVPFLLTMHGYGYYIENGRMVELI